MTTSPPSHVSLTKRDSYGFGIDIARAIANNKTSDLEDDDRDQDETIQAFTEDDSQVESSVFPADFANGLQEGGQPDTITRGIIPASSYGSHLRSPPRREGQSVDAEAAEDDPDRDTSFAPDRTVNGEQGRVTFDSYDITGNGSEVGLSVDASRRLQDRSGYGDDEFGEFVRGAQVSTSVEDFRDTETLTILHPDEQPQSVASSEGFGFSASGPSTPARKGVRNAQLQPTSSPSTPQRRASHLR